MRQGARTMILAVCCVATLLVSSAGVHSPARVEAQPAPPGRAAAVPWMRDRSDPRWVYGMVTVPTDARRGFGP